MTPRIQHGFLLAWSSLLLLHCIGPVEARRGFSGIGGALGTVDLKLTPKERALFAIAIVFGVFSLFLTLAAALFLKVKKHPGEDIRTRLQYGGLIFAATIWLTVYYGLDAAYYTRGSPSWDIFPSGIIPTRIFFFNLFIILFCSAIFLLMHHRRNSFNLCMSFNQPTGQERIAYTILPITSIGAMFCFTIAEVGLYSYYFSHRRRWVMPTWLLNSIRATSSLFVFAYVLFAITILTSAVRLGNEIKSIKEQAAPSHSTVEDKRQNELDDTLFKSICRFLVIHALVTLIIHIVTYFPDAFFSFGCQLAQLLVYGFLHLLFFIFLIGFGTPPDETEAQTQRGDTTAPRKPIPAWARAG